MMHLDYVIRSPRFGPRWSSLRIQCVERERKLEMTLLMPPDAIVVTKILQNGREGERCEYLYNRGRVEV